jgi:hypothetical protein
MLNVYEIFFPALGISFGLLTAAHAYHQGNLEGINAAEERRKKKAQEVQALSAMRSKLHIEHSRAYHKRRHMALQTISKAKQLCEVYRKVARRQSNYDFTILIPDFFLPATLLSETPPEPRLIRNHKEAHR